ncbi:uncharacterized protein LOC143373945 isoform X2 [Andrena cerasifolii]|uniref:uncharacterized protein LOC143373945 isoform X2 n=1 Tax=Andrena cerasifolii TaxID=2819439 RepID=UPI00403760A9
MIASLTDSSFRQSAISLLVGPELAQDHRMTRFFKGIIKLRPPRPKYDSTWDPKIVLDYLAALPHSEEMSLKELGRKLICFLALIAGHMMQTLSLIKVENIEEQGDALHIKIPDRIKTTGRNRNQPTLVLPYYSKNRKICVASTLDCYIRRTKDNRKEFRSLFTTSRKPFRPVTVQTLSHWVKDMLAKSGINTEIFTAHFTRHASTSAAKRKGVDLDTLRRTTGWTKSSQTFAKFYDLDVIADKNAFAKAILDM